MADSSLLKILLDIFELLCKSNNFYRTYQPELDSLLKKLVESLLIASMKDKNIKDLMIDLLTGHYIATKSNSSFF